jgi:hypothetical protein
VRPRISKKCCVIPEAIAVLVVLVLLYCPVVPMQSMAVIGRQGGIVGRYFHKTSRASSPRPQLPPKPAIALILYKVQIAASP